MIDGAMGASSGGILPLLLVCVQVFHFSLSEQGILTARCQTRCLGLLERQISHENGERLRRFSLNSCRQSSNCTSCLKPCSSGPKTITTCSELCELGEKECNDSCKFLKIANTVKLGSCPRIRNIVGIYAACVNECKVDGNCKGSQKCCPNSCGELCMPPIYSNTGLPPKPLNITVEERRKGHAVKVKWDARSRSSQHEKLLYVVQSRHSLGEYLIWGPDSQWREVAMSERKYAIVGNILAAHHYQFRVAAVNINGTKGFSAPSRTFMSTRDVQKPSEPLRLREGETIIHDQRLDLVIHWDPPKKTDLPVSKYTIYWMRQPSGISLVYQRIEQIKATVLGHKLSYKLENLELGTTYFVQVEAVVYHNKRRLKSARTSAFLTTYSPANDRKEPIGPIMPTHKDGIGVYNITVGEPYYIDGVIKADVRWKIKNKKNRRLQKFILHWWPEDDLEEHGDIWKKIAATSHKLNYSLFDLVYDCHYQVTIHAVSANGTPGPPSSAFFHTPECQDITIYGDTPPSCPTRIPRPPKKPPEMDVTLVPGECNVSVEIDWSTPLSDSPIRNYYVKWGESAITSATGRRSAFAYGRVLDEVKLPNDTLSYIIPKLRNGNHYTIEIWANSEIGSGQSSHHHINLPGVDNCNGRYKVTEKKIKKVKKTTTISPSVVPVPIKTSSSTQSDLTKTGSSTQKDSSGISAHCDVHRTLLILLLFVLLRILS